MENKKSLIDANAFLKSLEFEVGDVCEQAEYSDYLDYECGFSRDAIRQIIQKSQILDAVEVEHGRWYYINPTDTVDEHLMCTACKCVFWKNIEEMVSYPYCPNCGAKMDG